MMTVNRKDQIWAHNTRVRKHKAEGRQSLTLHPPPNSLRGALEAMNWTVPAGTKVSWTVPAGTKVSWTGPAEAKVSWTGPAEAKVSWTGPAEAKVSWTGPTLVGARAALTLVGTRAALTLVGALESWTEPVETKMSWAGPAEELESTCEESALTRSRHRRALARRQR